MPGRTSGEVQRRRRNGGDTIHALWRDSRGRQFGTSAVRIAVLGGGGAMGGLFGGYLARAGEDVVLVDVSEPAVDAIKRNGVSIEEKDGSTATIKVEASTSPATLARADLIVNFVKCYHTDAAVRAAMPMVG